MPLKFVAIRGATTVLNDTKEEIAEASVELTREIVRRNGIKKGEMVSLIISTTQDLHSVYPAKAIRESGLVDAPLFSTQEPDISGSQRKCIRFLLHIQTKRKLSVQHVYLRSAKTLRPDLKHRTVTKDKKHATKALPSGRTISRTMPKTTSQNNSVPKTRSITKNKR